MALYMIGIGLYDEKDITVRGLNAVRSCDLVFLENYTSVLSCEKGVLEGFYGKEVILADRDMVEKDSDRILLPAKEKDVAFLVVGDVMGATTHTDLVLRADELGVDVRFIFNASVMNAVGVVGLELYKYGKTTSIVFPDPSWQVDTPYDVIKQNQASGLHTLCLLDIKVKEPSKEDLLAGKDRPQDRRFMTVQEGLKELLSCESRRGEKVISMDTLVVGVARLGSPDMCIKKGPVSIILDEDFGGPLHSLIIPGKLHFVEEEALARWG